MAISVSHISITMSCVDILVLRRHTTTVIISLHSRHGDVFCQDMPNLPSIKSYILPQHLKDKAANPIYSYARRIMTWGSLQCHMSLVLCRPEGKKNSWWSIIIIIINIYRSTSSSRSIEHEYNMVISANDHGGVLSMTTILEKMRLAEYHHSEDEYQIS